MLYYTLLSNIPKGWRIRLFTPVLNFAGYFFQKYIIPIVTQGKVKIANNSRQQHAIKNLQ